MNNCQEDRITKLAGLVRRMVEESGNGGRFDAESWTRAWLATPLPALGCVQPISYLDSEQGYELLRQLLLRMQSGAFS